MRTKALHSALGGAALCFAILWAPALLVALPAGAATVYVAQHGSDGGSCGTKAAPCRTITRALDVAGVGDTIRVGPGRYGDRDGDGAFDDPGDEAAVLGSGCDCMIHVDKRVTLLSEVGAAATLLDGSGITPTVVQVSADGAVLGRANQGFTITGAGPALIQGAVETTASAGVAIGGNVAVANAGIGFKIEGAHRLDDNRASENYVGFFIDGATRLRRSVAVANDYGMDFEAPGVSVQDAVVAGNHADGVVIVSSATAPVLTRVHVLANEGAGISASASFTMEGGSVVDNDAGGANCGVTLAMGVALDADGVFWGSAAGPGADPADAVCGDVASADTDPPGKKATKPKLKPIR